MQTEPQGLPCLECLHVLELPDRSGTDAIEPLPGHFDECQFLEARRITAMLMGTAKDWKHPKHPSAGDWFEK